VSDWITQNKIPTTWFSIDKSDNYPVEFLTYIIFEIQKINAEFGANALNYLKASRY
jgi:LuxR family transcriptional regulator, maltose regulon positive regulatory protein